MRRREARKVYRAWLGQLPGWGLEETGGDHLRFVGPEGELVHVSATPSDHRALKNARSDLRRVSGRRVR